MKGTEHQHDSQDTYTDGLRSPLISNDGIYETNPNENDIVGIENSESCGAIATLTYLKNDTSDFLDLDHDYDSEESSISSSDSVSNFVTKLLHNDRTYGRLLYEALSRYQWYYPPILSLNTSGFSSSKQHPLKKYSTQTEAQQMESTQELLKNVTLFHRPSLKKAWDYFEFVTLPRHVVFPTSRGLSKNLTYAEPGFQNFATKLYSPLKTHMSQMGDFGLGIGLYLSILQKMSLMLLIAAILSAPNYIYFLSSEYSDGQPGIPFLLRGSAICTRMSLVPCPSCDSKEFQKFRMSDRLVKGSLIQPLSNATVSPLDTKLNFALKNNCDGSNLLTGLTSLVVVVFVVGFSVYLRRIQRRKIIELDEDEQTARDYSIVIDNPPPDASDALEWKCFFETQPDFHLMEHGDDVTNHDEGIKSIVKNGIKVASCTISVKNDFLLKSLVERKEIMYRIETMLAPGTPYDDINLARIAADVESKWNGLEYFKYKALNKIGVLQDLPSLYGRLIVLNAKIRGLAQLEYPVTKVFITFETEEMKNVVLEKLSVGKVTMLRHESKQHNLRQHHNSPSDHNQVDNNENDRLNKILFRSSKMLDVEEAEEPSTVRWTDLNASFFLWAKGQLYAYGLTAIFGVLIYFLVLKIEDSFPNSLPYLLSIFNVATSYLVRIITRFETHAFESGKQLSIFIKGSLLLLLNTFVVVQNIKPFASSITPGKYNLISTVYRVLFYDAVFTICLQLLDPIGHIKRHYLAPRAPNQEAMNSYFQGSFYDMADRYLNMWKVLDMTLLYGPIFPMIYVMGGIIFWFFSYIDRFSIMRTWYRAPKFGAKISDFSHVHIMSFACLLMAINASYFWSGFPFDDLCEIGPVPEDIYGTYKFFEVDNLALQHTNSTMVIINTNTTQYKHCAQDLFQFGFPFFPSFQPKGSKWMSKQLYVKFGAKIGRGLGRKKEQVRPINKYSLCKSNAIISQIEIFVPDVY